MSVRLCNLLSSPARTAEVVCEMSQTNRIKLISRNRESQRLRDPFNSHPCCPLNAASPPPSFLDFKNSTTELLSVSFFLKRSSLFNRPACAALHAGRNKFTSCSQTRQGSHQKDSAMDFLFAAVPADCCCCCCLVCFPFQRLPSRLWNFVIVVQLLNR